MQKNKKGFTLIELVVVMAIIAVLAALMVTAIVAARKAATNTQITGNAKTIETALETFSTKYSGKYPNITTGTTPLAADKNVEAVDAMGTMGIVEVLKSPEAFNSLSGGPAGLSANQIIYAGNLTGSQYTLTACDNTNTGTGGGWVTTDPMTNEGTLTEVGITPGKVNFLNAPGPCKVGKVIYSTAR